MHTIKSKKLKNQRGFTLIEMAIVVLLVGMAVAALSPLYKIYLKDQRIERTAVNIESIASAIGNFRGIYGRYPCPASLTLTRNDPGYGGENCDDAAAAPADREIFDTAIGTCTNGICVEQGTRTLTYTDPSTKDAVTGDYAAPVTQQPRVISGFIPFRQLNMDENDAYDGYGNRIMYVVTEHLAYSETFEGTGGAIEVLNEVGGQSVVNPVGSAHFLTFSFGENGAGAYTQAGIQTPCPPIGPERENTNCDLAADQSATYINADFGQSNNDADQFDDVMTYFTQNSIPLWQLSETAANRDRGDIHHKAIGKMGVLSDGVALTEENEVGGTVRAQDDPLTPGTVEGKIVINEICDENGINCFEPKIFSGAIDAGGVRTGGMQCPGDDLDGTGQFMVGIRNGTPICEDEVIVRCPAGQLMQGVDANGAPVCVGAPPNGCSSETRQICGINRNLPASADGDSFTLTAGANRQETYICEDENWGATPDTISGSCSCTPSVVVDNNASCGWGYTGTYRQTTTTVCPSGDVTVTGDRSPCACQLSSHTHSYACPDGLSGAGRVIRHRRLCSPDRWVTEDVSYDCSCVERTETRNGTCPTNEVGEIKQRWRYECPAQEWVFEAETSNTCRCENRTEIREKSCAPGLQGSIKEQWRFDCGSNTWSFIKETSNTCRTCQWESTGSGAGPFRFSAGGRIGTTCMCGTSENTCHQRLSGSNFRNFYGSCQCK